MNLRLCFVSVLLAKSFAFDKNSTEKSFAFYQNSNVIELSPSNFDKLVLQSDQMWIVQFYAPWCYYSQKIVPEYKQVANYMKEKQICVGAMEAHIKDPLFERLNLIGVPTINVFGKDKSRSIYYKGQRTAEDIVHFVDELIANEGEPKSDYSWSDIEVTLIHESLDGTLHLPLTSGTKDDKDFLAKYSFAVIMAPLYFKILS